MDKQSAKNNEQIKLPDSPEIQKEAFRIMEKHGPRDESEIAKREFNSRLQIVLITKSLLLTIPVLGVGLLGLVILTSLAKLISTGLWNALFGGIAIVYGLLCPALTARLVFRPADLLNVLRSGSFRSYT